MIDVTNTKKQQQHQNTSGEGGTRSPPAKSKMADGVWEGVNPQVFRRSKQHSLNKFFDPRTPSMRKVDNREYKKTSTRY